MWSIIKWFHWKKTFIDYLCKASKIQKVMEKMLGDINNWSNVGLKGLYNEKGYLSTTKLGSIGRNAKL